MTEQTLKTMTETFVLTYDHEQVLAENAALQAEIERLREENFALRQLAKPETRRIEAEQLQKLGARLAELLDEDKWAECEALLLAAGVTPNGEGELTCAAFRAGQLDRNVMPHGYNGE